MVARQRHGADRAGGKRLNRQQQSSDSRRLGKGAVVCSIQTGSTISRAVVDDLSLPETTERDANRPEAPTRQRHGLFPL
jgi:hypothetical protein